MRRWLAVCRFAVAVALLVYLGQSGVIRWQALSGLAAAWPLSLMAITVYLMDSCLTSWRFCLLVRPAGFDLSLWDSNRLSLIGLFFSTFLPGAASGDVVRIYYAASEHQGRRTELATIVLFDRIIGLVTMLIWPLMVAPFFLDLAAVPIIQGLLLAALGLAVGLAVALFAGSSRWIREHPLAQWCFSRIPGGRIMERVLATLTLYRTHPTILAGATMLSLFTHTLAAGVMLLIAAALDPTGFSWRMTILIPLGFLANQIPLTPGGLGVGEAALGGLLHVAGLAGGAEIMLGWRMCLLLVSVIGLSFYLHGRRSFVTSRSQPVAAREGAANDY
ncbi:MAG: hypothetical protein OJF47_003753 [Nitrospira sp.]|jgi:uncharacterized protein (TIRG00374 family)|nr:MAG: hypothetical protein OJF47_003753 [Nitrospira sp.]